MKLRWPFAMRSTVERLRLQQLTLLDALRNANEELRLHRKLIAGWRAEEKAIAESVRKIVGVKK